MLVVFYKAFHLRSPFVQAEPRGKGLHPEGLHHPQSSPGPCPQRSHIGPAPRRPPSPTELPCSQRSHVQDLHPVGLHPTDFSWALLTEEQCDFCLFPCLQPSSSPGPLHSQGSSGWSPGGLGSETCTETRGALS